MPSDISTPQTGPANLGQTAEAGSSSGNSGQPERVRVLNIRAQSVQTLEVQHIVMDGSGAGDARKRLGPWGCMGTDYPPCPEREKDVLVSGGFLKREKDKFKGCEEEVIRIRVVERTPVWSRHEDAGQQGWGRG